MDVCEHGHEIVLGYWRESCLKVASVGEWIVTDWVWTVNAVKVTITIREETKRIR